MREKKARTANYSFEETLRLVEITTNFKSILENKRTDAVSSTEKNKAWEKISTIFNSQTTAHRTPEQLRQKYESLKKETRKYYAQQCQQRLATGGGPFVEHKFHIIFNKVYDIIKLSTEGLQSRFISDTEFTASAENDESTENEETNISTNLAASSMLHYTDSQMSKLIVPSPPDIHYLDMTPKSSLRILESSIHSALDVSRTDCSTQPIVSDDDSRSEGDKKSGPNSEVNFGESKSPLQITRVRSISGRRKPIIRQPREPLSATARHLRPWASAKRELVQLQRDLLQKQHNERQRREEQLFQLKKRNLELDIKIKEKTLKNMTLL